MTSPSKKPPCLERFRAITAHCFITTPYPRLHDDLHRLLLPQRLQPEIGLEGNALWHEPGARFEEAARLLHGCGLAATIHAPFQDLTPGGFDERILDLSREKLRRAFALLPLFRPRSIVCHLGYNHQRHRHNLERWLSVSTETWKGLLPLAQAAGVKVMFENTYERDPSIHRALFARLEEFSPGFCLDVGHVLAFSSTPWQQWLAELGPWLGQLHLHDNDGSSDAHGPIGSGCFDFQGLLQRLAQDGRRLLSTLEQRSVQDTLSSLAALERFDTAALSGQPLES
ncbi:sugar phosphate isomerase/epimerase family protein [Desulfogranum mediterraneum]|uniref:sugar phosphate isomerase/epimerase family protein n=1 Tax=Desulfogranum mediterraneum TaxID=160661 RepID=UPI000400AD25|nr:sugar phosphate isomerase/epimerase [Desulfogranum mediterraneum]